MKLKCSTDSPHKRRLSFESKCLIFLLFSVLIIGAALLSDYDTLFPKESDLTTKSDGKIYWRDDGVAKCSVCRERMRTCNTGCRKNALTCAKECECEVGKRDLVCHDECKMKCGSRSEG